MQGARGPWPQLMVAFACGRPAIRSPRLPDPRLGYARDARGGGAQRV